jgi:hypothetical protein
MAMIQLPRDFKEFLQLLNSKEVDYLLVGGYAVSYHGYPRATGDMDIWIAIHPRNAGKVVEALKEFGFGLSNLSQDLFLEEERIIRMGMPPFRIEVFTTISGVDFDKCYARRVTDIVDGVEIKFISLEDLKLNKQASNRPKDINDLLNLP